MVKETICDFIGVIRLIEIREVKELHFGVDDDYKDKGIQSQGTLVAEYEFFENKEQKHSGLFKGMLYSRWYLDTNNQIKYDDIQSISDGYMNNAFIGIWKSYSTSNEKICNWGDFRVPQTNQDFDIGAGEFSVSEKYIDYGWLDIALRYELNSLDIDDNPKINEMKDWWKEQP